MNKKQLWVSMLVLGIIYASWMFLSNINSNSEQSLALRQAPSGGDFTLYSSEGPYSLKHSRGKVILIYFGYTFCPDICPTNLAIMSQTLNALDEDELQKVQGLFVSVDPERDTPERLANYTDMFHDSILGVSGDPQKVKLIAEKYGSAYNKVEGQSEGGYLVDHTSYTYVVNTDGTLVEALPHAVPAKKMLELVRELLAKDY